MSAGTITLRVRKNSFFLNNSLPPAEPRETSDILDPFASGKTNGPQITEEKNKQINEKQIHSCSTHGLARARRGQSQLFPGFPAPKSDSSHNGISTLVTASCTHTKGTQMKETCGGETEREILSFHAYLAAVGKSLLAKHSRNLELISESIRKGFHSPHRRHHHHHQHPVICTKS